MKLQVIAFGKLKTPGLDLACEVYRKRITAWTPFAELELKPAAVRSEDVASVRRAQDLDAERLLDTLKGTPYAILDEWGKARPTRDWARWIEELQLSGLQTPFALCIGSSVGFSDRVKSQARARWSLGPQTLSHELARLVLLEQLYRALSVVRGHPYHNE